MSRSRPSLRIALCCPLLFACTCAAQTVRLNKVVELFERKSPAFGSFVTVVSPRAAAEHASLPLDFVIVDMEHTPYDPMQLQGYLLGMINKRRIMAKGNLQPDVMPFVRLPANGREHTQFLLKQALDLGVFGVLLPHIDNREDALWAVRSARYGQRLGVPDFEPRGQRGVGLGWPARYWGLPSVEYAERADLWPLDPKGELLLWFMIESREGVEHAREIAAVPGVGGLFLGPGDLAFSLGVPLGDPRVEEPIRKVLAACRETGVPCGTVAETPEIDGRLQQGFRFLVVYNNPVPPAVGKAMAARESGLKK